MSSPKPLAPEQRVAAVEKAAKPSTSPLGNLSENVAIVAALLITCVVVAAVGLILNEAFLLMG